MCTYIYTVCKILRENLFQVVEQLKEKEVKKQEHIYELIITEKHHCRMLQVMQKVRFNNCICAVLALMKFLLYIQYF